MNSLPRLVGANIDETSSDLGTSSSNKSLLVIDESSAREIKKIPLNEPLDNIKISDKVSLLENSTAATNQNSYIQIGSERRDIPGLSGNTPDNPLVRVDSKVYEVNDHNQALSNCRTALEVSGGHSVNGAFDESTPVQASTPALSVIGAAGFRRVYEDNSQNKVSSTVYITPERFSEDYMSTIDGSDALSKCSLWNMGNTALGKQGRVHQTIIHGDLTVKDGDSDHGKGSHGNVTIEGKIYNSKGLYYNCHTNSSSVAIPDTLVDFDSQLVKDGSTTISSWKSNKYYSMTINIGSNSSITKSIYYILTDSNKQIDDYIAMITLDTSSDLIRGHGVSNIYYLGNIDDYGGYSYTFGIIYQSSSSSYAIPYRFDQQYLYGLKFLGVGAAVYTYDNPNGTWYAPGSATWTNVIGTNFTNNLSTRDEFIQYFREFGKLDFVGVESIVNGVYRKQTWSTSTTS